MPQQRLQCACAEYAKRWVGKGAVNSLLRCGAWACKDSVGISAVSLSSSKRVGVHIPLGNRLTFSRQHAVSPEVSYTPRLVSSFTSCCSRSEIAPAWQRFGQPRSMFILQAVLYSCRPKAIQACVVIALQSRTAAVQICKQR